MSRTVLALCTLLTFALPVAAQLSEEYALWPDGPVAALLTAAERTEYEALTSDSDAQGFIDLFWAKRDPDPATRDNEARYDFEARVMAADGQFAETETRGALTDRGRVLLLLGVPATHFQAGIGAYISDLYREQLPEATSAVDTTAEMHGVTFDVAEGKADIWEYSRDQIPESIDLGKRTKSVYFVFFDHEGTGVFELNTTLRRASTGLEVLKAMPAALVLHPELREPPVFPLIAGAEAATPAQLGWLGTEVWPEGAFSVARQGVALETEFPAWVFVLLPESVPAADLVVGRLTLPDGTVEGTFQTAATPIKSEHGKGYELRLPSPVGASTLELALAAGGQPVAVRSVEIQIDEVAADATYITPLFAGAQVNEQRDFEAGEPFIFGGYHLVPRPDGKYDYDEVISYFVLVVRPGLDEDGKPSATVRVRLKYQGKQVSGGAPQPAELSLAVKPNVYMWGSQLPLNILPKAGDYTLRVTVEDKVNGTKRTSEVPFVMPEKG